MDAVGRGIDTNFDAVVKQVVCTKDGIPTPADVIKMAATNQGRLSNI